MVMGTNFFNSLTHSNAIIQAPTAITLSRSGGGGGNQGGRGRWAKPAQMQSD